MKKLLLLFALVYFMIPISTFAQYSNATLSGPWVVTSENDLYIIFDGNGIVDQVGSSDDSLFPIGTYSVSSPGVVIASLNLAGGVISISGNMLTDSTASFYIDTTEGPNMMYKVSNPGALAGTWGGSLYDSIIQTTQNIQLTVNANGDITSTAGISLDSGKIFAGQGLFAGYIVTTDTACSLKYIQIYGADSSGAVLNGTAGLGQHHSNCEHKGNVYLTKITTGIKAINTGIDFSVYPDPFTNRLEIAVKNPANKMQVDLYDLLGRKMYSGEWNNAQNISLNLGALNSGLYLLSLTSNGQTITRRVVKN